MATIAGRYEIAAKIGQGGMGVVFRAYDPAPLNRHVAIKTLHESDPVALELFYKEITALKSIAHPNIVEIFDVGEYDDNGERKPFFVMPLLQGQTLEELISTSRHHVTIGRVIDIFAQTCRGLQAAHDHGLIHRDLKPSNIFVMRDDSVKIIDFGIAHAVSAQSRTREFKKGTLPYMAPEQLDLKPASVQSDIYSLGVTLYEALTRARAFRGDTEEEVVKAIQAEMPPAASDRNPAVPPLVSRVVHKAMAKRPWNRYDSAREFGDVLQRAGRGEAIDLFDPSRTQPRIQTARRALERGDHQFALELVNELEAEGTIDSEITLLRTEIEKLVRQKTIGQLLESARARFEEGEDLLALSKLHELLQLDSTNMVALALKSRIDDRRGEIQMEKWIQLARQHMDHHSYGHAREALQNALVLRPKDASVARLLKEIELAEQEYLRVCREKDELYQLARNAWQNGEVSQALSRMRAVIDLEQQAPATTPDASSKYKSFYDQLRSEEEAIHNGYAEARRHLTEKRFKPALDICADFLLRYPGQALFQALKFDIEEQRRQQLSRYIAEVDDRLRNEADLDDKVSLLREAIHEYPDEEHFKRLLTFFEEQRVHVKSILERARVHEAAGRFTEALADLNTLNTIHRAYPGLAFEQERLRKRLEQQTRQAAQATWVRQIDQQLASGNYARAEELLANALAECPDDDELQHMRQLALQGKERAAKAEALVAEARRLYTERNFDNAIDLLRIALQLDDRNSTRQALRDVLVARAHESLNTDWRLVLSFCDQALEIDPKHALAQSLRAQALDRKRDDEVAQCVSEARRLQAAGDIGEALVQAQKGLTAFPGDARLKAVVEALEIEQSRAARPVPLAPQAPAPRPATTPPRDEARESAPAARPVPVDTSTPAVDPAPMGESAPRPPTALNSIRRILSRPLAWGAVAALAIVAAIALVDRERDPSVTERPVDPPNDAEQKVQPAQPSTLVLQGLPAGLHVSVDGVPLGMVDETGAFTRGSLTPGRHTLLFSMDGYEPLTIEKEFAAGQALALSSVDVPLQRLSGTVQFVANAGTVITISQSGRLIQRINDGATISLAEGTYNLATRGPAAVETTQRLRVVAGASRVLDVRGFVVAGIELFEAGWTRQDDGWYRRRGGGVLLYAQPTPNGRFTFTVGRSPNSLFGGGARLKWLVAYRDGGNHVRFELDRNRLTRIHLVDGRATMSQSTHSISSNVPFLHLSLQISGAKLTHQYSLDGRNWHYLDDWAATLAPDQRRPLNGRFGLVIDGPEEVSISNFLFYPSPS